MSDTFYRQQLKKPQAQSFYDGLFQQTARGNTGGIYRLYAGEPKTAARDGLNAIKALHLDHPEFFHLGKTNRAILRGNVLTVINDILYSPEHTERLSRLLKHLLYKLSMDTQGLPAWERERIVYERIARYMRYENHREALDHNVAGPLLRKSGVCEGYTCLMTLTLRHVGIPCIKVSGRGRNEAHCWNLAWIDGKPCHLDVTWDREMNGYVPFVYFNLNDHDIRRTHTISTKGLPECTDSSLGFYQQSGLFFPSDRDGSQYIAKAFRKGAQSTQIRLADGLNIERCVKNGIAGAPAGRYIYHCNPDYKTAIVIKAT